MGLRIKRIVTGIVGGGALALSADVRASTIAASTSPPTAGGGTSFVSQTTEDAAINPSGSPSITPYSATQDVTNSGAGIGQIFVTPTASAGQTIQLNSITIAGVLNATNVSGTTNPWQNAAFPGSSLSLTVYTVTGSGSTRTLAAVASADAGAVPNPIVENDYLKIALATPLQLQPNTTYAFGVFDTTANGVYTVGTLHTTGTGNAITLTSGTSATVLAGQDRLFYANIQTVPEPASIGMLALGSIGLLARRRRPQ